MYNILSDADRRALSTAQPTDPQALHRDLARWNHRRLQPGLPRESWEQDLNEEHDMRRLEAQWVEGMREEIIDLALEAPSDPVRFIRWFEDLKETGAGQNDPLFPWLAEHAPHEEMCWFLSQETAGEAGFEDLVAMTQVKLTPRAKLELARNYWDEMGRGAVGGMHGLMLDATSQGLCLEPTIEGTLWESLALANTLTAFATTRRYAYHSVGALGVVELTAPTRVGLVADGLKRLGVDASLRKYFQLHAVLDVKHSQAWNEEALKPLITERPECARAIAEGALIRLECGRRCFDAYRRHLFA